MKIPNYQKQISYQFAAVRNVPLAQPVKAAQKSNWGQLAAAGKLLVGGVQAYQTFEKGKTEKAQDTSNQPEQNFADTPSSLSVHGQENPILKQADQEGSLNNFSDPARRDLLAFGRQQSQHISGSLPDAEKAVEQLDQYVSQHYPSNSGADTQQQAQSLFAQDYVIVRNEMQQLAQQQLEDRKQQDFNQGAKHFIETAALIRTPEALESYIQSNLEAAGKEKETNATSSASWTEQKKYLYSQAVCHNVQSALQTGEIRQAQGVYEHFAASLSEEQSKLLQEKITTFQAQKIAQSSWAEVEKDCMDEAGHISKQRLQEWVRSHEADQAMEEPVQAALLAQLQQQSIHRWKKRADFYDACLSSPSQIMGFETEERQDPKQWQKTQQLVWDYQAAPQAPSNNGLFNQLYEQALAGQLKESALDQAFAEKQLSAADTLRLKHAFCLAQAHQTDPREKILSFSLQHLCSSYDLSSQQQQAAIYYVYRNGSDFASRLQAAQDLKKILNLQEKIK